MAVMLKCSRCKTPYDFYIIDDATEGTNVLIQAKMTYRDMLSNTYMSKKVMHLCPECCRDFNKWAKRSDKEAVNSHERKAK